MRFSPHFYHTGDYVYVHGAAATPLPLLESLAAHGKSEKLKDVSLIHIHTEGPGICQQPEYEGTVSTLLSSSLRPVADLGGRCGQLPPPS